MHAKALITDRGMIIGSANWSNNAETNGMDIDVLLQTEREVNEGYQLFGLLWTAAAGNELTESVVVRSMAGANSSSSSAVGVA